VISRKKRIDNYLLNFNPTSSPLEEGRIVMSGLVEVGE